MTVENQADTTQSGNQPTYIVWFVPDRDNAPWTRIGAQWPTKAGTGFRQVLNFVPRGEGNIVVLPYEPKSDGDTGGSA